MNFNKPIPIPYLYPRASGAALNRGRRLFEGGAYLKIGRYKEIFSFNLKVYLPSVRKSNIM